MTISTVNTGAPIERLWTGGRSKPSIGVIPSGIPGNRTVRGFPANGRSHSRTSESKVRLFVIDPVSVPFVETRYLTTSKPISASDVGLNEQGWNWMVLVPTVPRYVWLFATQSPVRTGDLAPVPHRIVRAAGGEN
jgi:hypothetical protein